MTTVHHGFGPTGLITQPRSSLVGYGAKKQCNKFKELFCSVELIN